MAKIIHTILLLCCLSIKAQKIKGKTYIATTSVSCMELSDGGGCSIYQYCYLQFEKKYANVFFKSVFYCSSKERELEFDNSNPEVKKYSWKKEGETIIVKGFNNYGILKIEEGKLVGTKEMNYKEFVPTEFKEELCQKK